MLAVSDRRADGNAIGELMAVRLMNGIIAAMDVPRLTVRTEGGTHQPQSGVPAGRWQCIVAVQETQIIWRPVRY